MENKINKPKSKLLKPYIVEKIIVNKVLKKILE